jgi:perosamine synthetase
VFVDVDPITYNIDPQLIETAITTRTKAILVVHQIGMPCDLARIVPLAKRRGLPLIEDAACAIGSEILWDGQWHMIGRPHGDVACFSFHPRKVISTGDGGMITTRHADWDRQFRLLRQHAMSVPDTVRHGSAQVIFESYPTVGYNYRMTDIQAAIGIEQLAKLDRLLARRREIARRYDEAFRALAGVQLPARPAYAEHAFQSYAIRLLPECPTDRDALLARLVAAGISCRRGIPPIHLEPLYRDRFGSGPLPVTEAVAARSLFLPIFASLEDEDQTRIIETVLGILAR